jgi:hypothetical protein
MTVVLVYCKYCLLLGKGWWLAVFGPFNLFFIAIYCTEYAKPICLSAIDEIHLPSLGKIIYIKHNRTCDKLLLERPLERRCRKK